MTCSNETTNDSFSMDPDSNLDYDCDWSAAAGPWLKDGDTIAEVDWIVPAGITQTDQGHTDTKTTIWLTGGELGKTYEVVTHITTTAGRSEDQTQYFYVENH